MSIPKEPRQLMINLMYLVLTALLALNVSAEVFNAFDQVDRSLGESNLALDANNTRIEKQIPDLAKKKPEYAKYAEQVPQVREASKNFVDAVQAVVDDLIDKTGDGNGTADAGDYKDEYGNKVL